MTFKYPFIFLLSTLMLNAVRERIEIRVGWAKRIGGPSSDSKWQRTLHCAIIVYSRKCLSERSAIVWLDVLLGMRPGTLLCREGTTGWGRTLTELGGREGRTLWDPSHQPQDPELRYHVLSNSVIRQPIRKEWSRSWFVILGISFQVPSHSGWRSSDFPLLQILSFFPSPLLLPLPFPLSPTPSLLTPSLLLWERVSCSPGWLPLFTK